MAIKDPFLDFPESIIPTSCRIVKFPSLVFLCGGQMNNGGPSPYSSARHYFYDIVIKNKPAFHDKIILAESITEWFRDDYYDDLLSLEQDIAGLAAAIVVFVESAGSIAELGAFSKMEVINKKLLIIIQERYADSKSFISDGPVKFLSKVVGNAPYAFDWEEKGVGDKYLLSTTAIDDEFEEIGRRINDKIINLSKETLFDSDNVGHILMLIADILYVFGLARLDELYQAIGRMKLSLTKKRLETYLFLLEKLKFISKKSYRDSKFYICNTSNNYIKYSYTSSASLKDRRSWIMSIRDWLEKNRGLTAQGYKYFLKKGCVPR